MAFKINMSKKDGKTFRIEVDTEAIIGKKIGETIDGSDIKSELAGYEFEITGLSDKAGLPSLKQVEGQGLKRVLLTYGKAMHKKPKGLRKRRRKSPPGLRLRKSIRGNTISKDIVQINTQVTKEGSKKLEEIFPEQAKPKEKKKYEKPEQVKETEQKVEENKEIKQETK